MESDKFINISDDWRNVNLYVIRTCIWNAVQKCAPAFTGHLLDVGCGCKPYRSYLLDNKHIDQYTGLDIATALVYDNAVVPDFTWDGVTMPFEDNSFDTIMATEVLEHCPDAHRIINEMKRVVKPGGLIFFTVPFLWNLHEVPHDEFRYTPFALRRIFNECELEKVELFAHGAWHTSMAQMIGMWVEATKRGSKRRRWAKLLFPVIKWLMKKDKYKHSTEFTEGMMINGIYGMVRKKSGSS
jgi:SAM-dependent methyltransferase